MATFTPQTKSAPATFTPQNKSMTSPGEFDVGVFDQATFDTTTSTESPWTLQNKN